MSFMPWNDDYRIGIDKIDEQHRWLFKATNDLYEEMNKEKPDSKKLGEILHGLVDYAFNHFIIEEELFIRHGYPQAESHKVEHDAFNAKACDILSSFESGKPMDNSVTDYLKNWLQHHIMVNDKAYVPFLADKAS